jgi:Skp family chaperone for outer membrane proteins
MSLLLPLLATLSAPAYAQEFQLGVVDYSRAIQDIEEGKKAQSRLDAMYAGEKAKLEQLEAEYNALLTEYQSKAAVLSDTAKAEYEQRLMELQYAYQQALYQAEWEMQGAYFSAMEQLMSGLRTTAEEVGASGNYDLILESSQGIVLYHSGEDLTDKVIAEYNKKHSAPQ